MVEENTLPDGWKWVSISEIADTTSGGTPLRSHAEYYGGNIPWVKSGELRDGTIRDVDETITELGLKKSSAKLFPIDTVVVALYGATVGRTGILGFEATTNQAVCGIFPREKSFIPKYMFYWLQSQREYLVSQSVGGAQPNISQGIIRSLVFPLPPLPEQERIVAKIEELFTQLEAGEAALRRARAGLKRYKASVLKAACEGRLAAQDPSEEPAEELLRRSGKSPLAGEDYPPIPLSWQWVSVAQLASNEAYSITDGPFGSKLKTEHYTDIGPRVIRLQNIGDGEFRDEQAHISQEHFLTLQRHRIFANDLVIAGLGESLPRACMIPEHVGAAIVKADCFRFKPNPEIADVRYLLSALNSDPIKKLVAKIVHGIGRPRMNQQEIKAMPIPLPSLSEQRRIVAEVERRLSVAAEIESSVEAGLARAARLRQSILKRAFEGKLAGQDPRGQNTGELGAAAFPVENSEKTFTPQQARLF